MRAINDAFEASVRQGMIAVVAAGNEGRDACEVSPASARLAITVGSVDQNNRISEFSNYGKCVDIYAPGERVVSTLYGNRTTAMSGTSMAAPLVAGVVAMNVYHDKDYAWVETRLKQQGTEVAQTGTQMVQADTQELRINNLPLSGTQALQFSTENRPRVNNLPYLVLFNGVCGGCGDVFL